MTRDRLLALSCFIRNWDSLVPQHKIISYIMIYYSFGIDVSKNTLDIAFYDGKTIEKKHHLKVSNDQTGFDSMFKWMTSRFFITDIASIRVCFENTGVYSRLLQHYMEQKGVTYYVVGGDIIHKFTISQNEHGLRNIKTDKADAIKIAIFCHLNHQFLSPSRLPSPALQQLRRLVSERRRYLAGKTGFKARISGAFPEESDATLSRWGCYLESFEGSVKEVEKEILNVINSDEALQRSYNLLDSIPGIGLVLASDTIAYTENFTKITDPRKYCAFIGLMSYEQSSGKIKGKPKRKVVRHPAKKNLGAACVSNISKDPYIRSMYDRMKSQGKLDGVIYNRIKCFMVRRMFGVIRRGTPFEHRDISPSL